MRRNPLWSQFQAPVRPLTVTGLDAQALATQKPFAFVLGDLEIRDALRIGSPQASQFKAALRDDYVPSAVVERKAPLSGLLNWVPPQDWLYPFPTETVYLRRAAP